MIIRPTLTKLLDKVPSKYSLVIGTAKRARQLIDGREPLVRAKCNKPLSIAVEEVYNSKVRIVNDED